MTWRGAAIAVVLLGAGIAAQSPSADESRAAWRYRRQVRPPDGATGTFVAVPIPPEVSARSQGGLADVRLVDAAGRETPFLVVEDRARDVVERVTGTLVESREERRLGSSWSLDLGSRVTFDRLELDLPGRDFAKRFAVEASDDGTAWLVLSEAFWAFDRTWEGRQVHHTALDVPSVTTRYVRFTADDTRSAPVAIRGAAAVRRRQHAGSNWTRQVALTALSTAAGRTRYAVPVPPGYPVRRLEIDADDPTFARPLTVSSQRDGQDRAIGQGTVFRLRLPDAAADVSSRAVDVASPTAGDLVVEVDNGDSPPLTNPRVILSGPQTLLLAATSAPSLTVYYGNPVTRRAVYDLERLRPQLTAAADILVATLGDETENPRFRPPVPLGFMAARGAVVESARWRFTRALSVQGADDLYALTLEPTDVARARADLADVRLVDRDDRQVPFVLERDVETASLALDAATRASGRPRVSAWQLRLPATTGGAAVSLNGLELRVADAFFRRTATVAVPAADAPLGRRVIATTTIAATGRDDATGSVVRLSLGAITTAELILEIEDGDNAALNLVSAHGLAPVPRLTFKAAAGDYRLLLGRDDVTAPSYELDQLRREVLDYAAVPVPAAWLAATAPSAGARSLTGLLREPPATAVLWGTLGVAIVVLLALTRRIVRGGSAESGR